MYKESQIEAGQTTRTRPNDSTNITHTPPEINGHYRCAFHKHTPIAGSIKISLPMLIKGGSRPFSNRQVQNHNFSLHFARRFVDAPGERCLLFSKCPHALT